jgi:hypothetical protein
LGLIPKSLPVWQAGGIRNPNLKMTQVILKKILRLESHAAMANAGIGIGGIKEITEEKVEE